MLVGAVQNARFSWSKAGHTGPLSGERFVSGHLMTSSGRVVMPTVTCGITPKPTNTVAERRPLS